MPGKMNHQAPVIIEVRIERDGNEVHLVLVSSTSEGADAVAADLVAQLKDGAITIRLRDDA